MITQEEYALMKQQLLQMTDEHEEMENEIALLTTANAQIPGLKQQLEEIKSEYNRINQEFEKTQLNLNNKLAEWGDPNKAPVMSRTASEMDIKFHQTTDSLTKAEAAYEAICNDEANAAEELAMAAAQENELTMIIQESGSYFQKYDLITSQMEAVKNVGIQVQDLIVQLDILKKEREGQHNRRVRLNNWLSQAQDINKHQMASLDNIKADLAKITEERNEAQDRLSAAESTLAGAQLRASESENKEKDLITELENKSKEMNQKIEKANSEVRAATKKLETNKEEIDELENVVANYRSQEKKSINKRIAMVRDLEKRLRQERQNIPTVDLDSPFVIELTRTVDLEMCEREAAIAENKATQKDLERTQEELQRKETLVEEFSSICPSNEPMSDEECLAGFLNFCYETEIKHANYVADLQGVAEILACLQSENAVLRETAAELGIIID